MKRIILIALALSAITSCAPHPGALAITGFSPLGSPCAVVPSTTIFQSRGLLDVANGAAPFAPKYYIQVNYQTFINGQALSLANGTVLEYADREKVELNTLHLTYASRKGSGAVKTLTAVDDLPLGIVALGLENGQFGANIIGPKGGVAILNEVPATTATNGKPTADDEVEIRVGVELQGILSGSGTPVVSGTVYFPLTVVRSTGCATYASPMGFCPFPGQDSTSPLCGP